MKKNNLKETAVFSELLSPLNFLLLLSGRAYEKYMGNKIYLHALNIRKSNQMIYQLLLDKLSLIPEEIQQDCIELLNHYDCWMLQFKEEEEKLKPSMKDPFIFYRIDEQVAFPRVSEQKIFGLYNKYHKQKNKRS